MKTKKAWTDHRELGGGESEGGERCHLNSGGGVIVANERDENGTNKGAQGAAEARG